MIKEEVAENGWKMKVDKKSKVNSNDFALYVLFYCKLVVFLPLLCVALFDALPVSCARLLAMLLIVMTSHATTAQYFFIGHCNFVSTLFYITELPICVYFLITCHQLSSLVFSRSEVFNKECFFLRLP